MPSEHDEREWTLTVENYVWRAGSIGTMPVVKNGKPIVVVPKARALAALPMKTMARRLGPS
jgi:hypothetical protein